MISLGLARVRELLRRLGNPENAFPAFHVAGTNGKGSVCTYIESVLGASGTSTGKFTSPHLITPNDAIRINRKELARAEYDELVRATTIASQRHGINATEFEIQTAVAFQAFKMHKVDVGVVEVGLGGLEDATNVLPTDSILCSAITKIAVDHEGFLGSTLEAVAAHKAGIMRPGKPCVVDGTNVPQVLDVFRARARDIGARLFVTQPASPSFREQNLAVALAALKTVYPHLRPSIIDAGVEAAVWPGRLQWVRPATLVDGAHNAAAAAELRRYVDALAKPVRWVVAFSKPADEILRVLVREGDSVVVTTFGSVEGMPWISPQPAQAVAQLAQKYTPVTVTTIGSVRELSDDFDGLTVVCGSLYLVGEYLKCVEERGN